MKLLTRGLVALASGCLVASCSDVSTTLDGGVDAATDTAVFDGGIEASADVSVESAANEAGLYGVPWNADALSNDQIGYIATRKADIRFRSGGGTFASLKVFFIIATYVQRSYCNQPPFTSTHPNDCYAAGTGGIIRVDLEDDDGTPAHAPSGNVLATTTIGDPMNHVSGPPIYGVSDANFRVLSNFSASPALTNGALYHFVFSNIDADPTQNYVSIDCLYVPIETPHQPGVSDIDLATLLSDDDVTWTVRMETPIFEVQYADSHVEGQGYMDTRVLVPATIAGGAIAREQFTASDAHTLTSVSVRVKSIGTPSALAVRLENGDGSLIEEGALPASSFPNGDPAWATYVFQTPHALAKGQTYHLALDAADDAGTYQIYPLEKGTTYGFDPSLTFGDGHADYTDGGAGGFATNYPPWGTMSELDYQIYFVTQ